MLKKAVRGIIPDALIDRKKQGFGLPLYEWYFDALGNEIYRELEGFCKETDFLNWEEVSRMCEKKAYPIWYLFNFALWWRRFI